jgi:hypothetical protein
VLVPSRPEVDVLTKLESLNSKNLDTAATLVELNARSLDGPVNARISHKLSALEGRDGYDEDALVEVSSEIRQRTHEHVPLGPPSIMCALRCSPGSDGESSSHHLGAGRALVVRH